MKKGTAFCLVVMSLLFAFSLAYAQPAPLWRTGQTVSYAAGDDGAMQRGVAWPASRFTDNGDGTVTDNLTGLMWLKNGHCFRDNMPWQEALDKVSDLNANAENYSCGGYTAAYNDWRLPNRKELYSLIDFSRYDPALPEGHPFLDIKFSYWSSTTNAHYTSLAWVVEMYSGSINFSNKSSSYHGYVWPVRTGQTGEMKVPTITTTAVSSITSNSALSGGNVTSNGGANVTAKGVCWSTSANPTTGDSKTTNGSGTGIFTSSITGLSQGTTYHVRAYAANSVGTGYGSDHVFTTTSTQPTVPTEPTLTVATSGITVTVSWTSVATATGYTLFYAPYPYTGPDSIGSVDMGSQTGGAFDLWAGAAFYVAVQAYNSAGNSGYSNIEYFSIGSPISHITISGFTQVTEGSGAQYTCTAYHTDGSSSVVTNLANWSENSSYASISSTGYLNTSSVSSDQYFTITANYRGRTNTRDVTIKNEPQEIFLLPDTDQTKCYDAYGEIICPKVGESFYGQDGNYIINPTSYTKMDAIGNDLSDTATSWAMVRDNLTQLIWEMKSDDGSIHDKDNTYDWPDAQDEFIKTLNNDEFGGYSDWRLPEIGELMSLGNYDKYEPAINSLYFPNVTTYCWSCEYSGENAWFVRFTDGTFWIDAKSNHYMAFAVRGNRAISNRFIDNGDFTVTDTHKGLIWQQQVSNTKVSWEEGLQYCENLVLAGRNDWRLPNVKELSSLIDRRYYAPTIDQNAFSNANASSYWSSTTQRPYASNAYNIGFWYGSITWVPKSDESYFLYARCVCSELSGE